MSTLLELMQQKQKDLQAQQGRQRTVKITQGQTTFRILPHKSGNLDAPFFHDYGQHFVKDFSGKTVAVYICAAKTFAKDCAICDQIESGIATVGDANVQGLLKEARSGSRYLLNVVKVKANGQFEAEVELMEVPMTVFQDIVQVYTQYKAQHGLDIISLEAGYNITVNRTGSGQQNTRYSTTASPQPTAIDPSYLERAHDLDAYVAQESDEQLKRAMAAIGGVSGASTPALPASMTSARLPNPAGAPATSHDPTTPAPPGVVMGAPTAPAPVAPAAPVAPVAPAPVAPPVAPSATPVAPAATSEDLSDISLDDIDLDDLENI